MFYSLAVSTLFLARLISADFIIANTTSCYGDFFLGSCSDNVQVISNGVSYEEDFTCHKLYKAQTSRYVETNTAGAYADSFTSTSDVCGAGRLYFERNYTSDAVNGTFNIYKGTDSSGDSVGTCEYTGTNVTESKRRCSQLFGTIFYEGAYRCNTTLDGYFNLDEFDFYHHGHCIDDDRFDLVCHYNDGLFEFRNDYRFYFLR
ncbi:Hypothetical predicted protein [Lecanosticta acicola]|uniref:Uncharacterized protein n=1 Tax=Lecanosticta acicola TaxID=111012 RepID=A0AAI8Z8R5_9PEZI|nr:Hypothetical predicted protein [Lecanosticta acicola]